MIALSPFVNAPARGALVAWVAVIAFICVRAVAVALDRAHLIDGTVWPLIGRSSNANVQQ
jgi:hypothetical protein